jgi:hypothetical protein
MIALQRLNKLIRIVGIERLLAGNGEVTRLSMGKGGYAVNSVENQPEKDSPDVYGC